MSNKQHQTFEAPDQLYAWLLIFKKATGQPSVTWEDCAVAAICWGWIDAVRKSLD